MLNGTLLVLSACFIWGLIFVIPGMMGGFSSLEIALCRYFFLGVVSSIFLLSKGLRNWQKIPWPIWRRALLYSLLVNIIYYFSLVTGILYSGASIIVLIAGISPITLTFYGNWSEKQCSFKQLLFPCFLICCGLLCVNSHAFSSLHAETSLKYGFGLLCGIISLVIWNWYVIANADFLKKNPVVTSSDWATLIGVGTFAWVILIGTGFLFFVSSDELIKYSTLNSTLLSFLFGGLVLGLVCSWLGSYLWNQGSQALPISLAGQLTIFETIFGLLFVYLIEQRLPSFIEFVGILIILGAVKLSMTRFNQSISIAS